MTVLLDGGFSSQVKQYVDLNEIADNPLWCAQFLASNPEAVINTHSDYVEAGCNVVTTNTYQASIDGFKQQLGLNHDQSLALIKHAVELARKAIQKSAKERKVLVAGSVGAYGACLHDLSEYRGEYVERVSQTELMDWHRPRVSALVEAGVDLLAVETIPAAAEATAVLTLLKNEFPNQKAWVSFTSKDETCISHGEPFREAVAQCYQVNRAQLVAVGVNCLNPALVSPLLKSAQDQQVPFIVYPNSGEVWTSGVGWTNKEACVPLTHYLPEWIALGAKYIGGCCRTTADDMKLFRDYIDLHKLQPHQA